MKKILGLLIALMITTKAFASITVMPTKVELNANKKKGNYLSTSIEVRGDEKQVMRFRAYTGYFKINELGEIVSYERQKSNEIDDISKKIKFVPSEFTIQPGKSQKIRLNIIGINALPDGENRCLLYIEDVNPKEIAIDTGRSSIGAQLIVKTRVAVPVYVDKGKFTKHCEVENFNITKDKNITYANAKLVNTGNSKIRYTTYAQIISGKKLIKEQSLGGGVVGSNNYRKIATKIDTSGIQSGTYVLRYSITYKDENGKIKIIKNDTEITI